MARRSGRARGAVEEPAPESEEVQQPEAAQEPEAEDTEEMEENAQSENEQQRNTDHFPALQFDEELSWRPGKPIPIATLLKRLEKLSEELAAFEQEEANLNSIRPVAQKLIHRNLIQHKDKGVKAYTACCLVDILRLFVPDAPYSNDELKLLFGLFIKDILPALHDPTSSYPTQHKYVLTSLTEVKSILLLPELGSDELVLRLFNSTFDGVSTSSKSKDGQEVAMDIEIQLSEMLIQLIEEYPGSMPASIIDAIISQFLRVAPPGGSGRKEQTGQSTLLHKTEPPAYIMARNICNSCDDKMARYVAQYFSDVVLNASKFAANAQPEEGAEEEAESRDGPTDVDIKSLRQAHDLMRELWRAAPTVLQNVVSLLYSEVIADDPHIRRIGTETIGYMVAGIGAAGPPDPPVLDPTAYPPIKITDDPSNLAANTSALTTPYSPHSFAQAHSDSYKEFIRRCNDRVTDVRAVWTTTAGHILATSAGGVGLSRAEEDELVKKFAERLCDPEEKVRLAAIQAIQFFEFRDIVTKLGAFGGPEQQGSVLYELADRVKDKRTAVRVEATILLGNLWAVGAGELAEGQEAVTACLGSIPSRIMSVFYLNDPELNVLLDRVMHECLVPLKFPQVKGKDSKAKAIGTDKKGGLTQAEQDKVRTERVLLMLKSLDASAKKAFFGRQSHQAQFRVGLGGLVKSCEAYNGGLANGDASKVKVHLDRTCDWLAQQLPESQKVRHDLAKLAKLNDRRVYQLIKYAIETESDFQKVRKSINELVNKLHGMPSVQDTLVTLLYRAAPIMLNRSHLTTIMDYSKSDKGGFAEIAHAVLNDISTQNPDLFKAHAEELRTTIADHAPSASRPNEIGVVDMLKAYSSFSKKYPEDVPQDRSFSQTLVSYALHGRPHKAAKYAINLLMATNDDKARATATNLLQKVMADIKYESPNLLNRLAAISQLERLAPIVAADYDDAITDLTIKGILRKVRTDATDQTDWVDDAAVDDELQAKCLAMKILVNRALANADEEDSEQRAKALFKLLKEFVAKEGEFCKDADTPMRHRRRLRLLAGQSLLKLCTSKKFDDQFDASSFNKLAVVIQDPVTQVRRRFADKLQSYLARGKLRARFVTILFIGAFEPMAEIKARNETWLRSRTRYYTDIEKPVMEALMGRLIPLLAHHPDYSDEVDDLVDFANYILFYLGVVADEHNISHIYKYAERVKQTRDALSPENSDRLYTLSDLAMTVIRKYQERRGWSFQAWGKVGLPQGLFVALPSSEVAQEIAKKQYLPEELDAKLDDLLRSLERRKKRKSMHESSEQSAKKQKQIKTVIREKGDSSSRPKSSRSAKPKKKKASKPVKASPAPLPPSERRRSGRQHLSTSYKDRGEDEDEEEMMDGVATWKYEANGSDHSEEDESGSEDGSSAETSEDDEITPPKRGSATKGTPALKAAVLKGTGRKPTKADNSDMDVDDEEDEG